ncbi:MAG: nodulation protein NfeD [Bacteroidetes bacterium]|nr:MAG: nodulation protein NfeD [Bacteroidota bacterium]RLD93959.1 MAG: nodulation protein NfeD [Bacteroidota bacterium]RLE05990.1 MAG: nodulation protein NfeD [Bacteroidota bacterium]
MKQATYTVLAALLVLVLSSQVLAPDTLVTDSVSGSKTLIYTFAIKDNIAAPTWRITQEAIEEAIALEADVVILHLNTYGGEVSAADSIRTKLLNAPMPVHVFIDDNAASAGALIAIACDSIYMKPGGKIGAATVVNQTGEQVPDKYQSYMRATMRATAEAHGKDTLVTGSDTLYTWHRDPAIAEAMVDPKLYVEGVSDTGQVLTFTASEAIAHGYCEGTVESMKEVIARLGFEEYELSSYKPTGMDKMIGFLINPMISGVLIMIIIGGIYFELQSPGIGFALGASIVAALLYFAPLYLEGMAENWELILFIVGIILIMVEIFAIPGFGVAGVAGIIAVITGLTLSLVDNVVFEDPEFTGEGLSILMKSLSLVLVATLAGIIFSLWATRKLLTTTAFTNLSLKSEQRTEDGFIGVETKQQSLIGELGVAHTVLRPSGRVMIQEQIYDAMSEYGLIEKGEAIKVIRYETGQVYVVKA